MSLSKTKPFKENTSAAGQEVMYYSIPIFRALTLLHKLK